MGTYYTAEDVRLITHMVARGDHTSVIAKALGRTNGSVVNKLAILRAEGVVPPGRPCVVWTVALNAALATLVEQGKTHKQIALAMQLSENVVKHRLHRLRNKGGVPVKPRPDRAVRKCLCCGGAFQSWGPGNRLCVRCRGESVSPYAL